MKISTLHIGAGSKLGPLTLFPVWTEGLVAVGLTTGAAANLQIIELASGPQVSKLTVTNRDTKPVLLLEGELLEGGHQHRVCAQDVILAPGETRDVETYCVEQGRWGGASVHGRSARRAPLNVRAELNRATRGPETQSRVWERVARYQGLHTVAGSGSLVEHLDAGTRHAGLDLAKLPRPIEGQRGVVVGFGGKALMLELFGSHRLFVQHYRPLVEAAWLDIQVFAGNVPSIKTPAQSARDLAVRLTELVARLDGSAITTGDGRVTASGIAWAPPKRLPALAHLSSWDTHHPMMAI